MSNIRHPHPVQTHAQWYAAAAVLLAVLMIGVLQPPSSSVAIRKPPPRGVMHEAYRFPCAAGHPNTSAALPACRA
jgi:hypothetical protein